MFKTKGSGTVATCTTVINTIVELVYNSNWRKQTVLPYGSGLDYSSLSTKLINFCK